MAINVDYKGIEIGELTGKTTETFVPGRPVTLNTSDGQVIAAGAQSDVVGLVKEALISGVLDEVSGEFGIYGSGRVSILTKGIVTVQNSVVDGTSYSVYDTALTYSPLDKLYANSSGLITNAGTYTGITRGYLGFVLVEPTNPANGDPMQIQVE